MQFGRVELPLGHSILSLESGRLAKQAHGAVVVRYGDTMVLVTACEGDSDDNRDFFPLTVDYREKPYAAGRFPGGYIKREGRPSLKETLTSRLIDRPIRPLFPANYFNEVQVLANVMSADRENDPDVHAMIGASACLHISHIPFLKPTGAVRVGRIAGQLVLFPTYDQMEESDLDLIVAGTRDAITMIEGFARDLPEDQMLAAIMYAHENVVKIVDLIESLRPALGLPEKQYPPPPPINPLIEEFRNKFGEEFRQRKFTEGKVARAAAVADLKERILAEYLPAEPVAGAPVYEPMQVHAAISALEEYVVRQAILEGRRIDGRSAKQLRDIECHVGILPRTHGSALFQRGETQALVTTTLGTGADEQKVEGLVLEYSKKFMLDYNFPPFSVGECKPLRGPGRREIGHGALAERSLNAVIPPPNKFPYTIRVVSDILESNGSSSMASVCGGTLSMMDAGVPILQPVAGISIGLVKDGDRYTLLTDIQGDEDHYGDMDFKVAGTPNGITGIQLDLKIDGIGEEIIRNTLQQAREARREILKIMLTTLRKPRAQISEAAPRLLQIRISPDKIGLLIGPGGKTIKGIQEATGAKIDIEDDGTVSISHSDSAGAEAAKARVEALTEDVKVGKIYEGKVSSITDFGAFVEIIPGRDGLVHVSELDDKYVSRVEDVCRVGDRMRVKVILIDSQDRVKLSRKAVLQEERAITGSQADAGSGGRDGGGRDGSGRDGGGRGGRDSKSGSGRRQSQQS